MRSCFLLGLDAEARALLARLEIIAAEHPGRVTAETLEFWRRAVGS